MRVIIVSILVICAFNLFVSVLSASEQLGGIQNTEYNENDHKSFFEKAVDYLKSKIPDSESLPFDLVKLQTQIVNGIMYIFQFAHGDTEYQVHVQNKPWEKEEEMQIQVIKYNVVDK